MPHFLSSSWLDQLTTLAGGDELGHDATVIQHVVTGGPGGEVAFVVEIDAGHVRARPGRDGRAVVTLTETWETAVKLHLGELTAREAFMGGLVRVRGDIRRVLPAAAGLSSLGPALSVLRECTADG